MALIKCPECKKKISDQCKSCPQCGYPIKNSFQPESSETVAPAKKLLLKKAWLWIVVGVVLVAIVLSTILLLNRDTQPKLDENGNPVFVELTNEVYTNANDYKGYHINIKGQVFQVMSDDGSVKGIQIWLDPDTCEQNMMIYYNTDVDVKQGDYIMCSGYIDSVAEYKNAYDATRYAPLVFSSDLVKATYIDVMAPAIETIMLENLKQEKYGYSFSIDKIEFAENETRIYATATNNGKEMLYFSDAVIVQDSKQYNSTTNYDADYDEIPFEIVKGVTSSGIIVFPAMSINVFELTIDVRSDETDEKLGKFTVLISKKKSEIKSAWPVDKPIQAPTSRQLLAVKKANEFFETDSEYLYPCTPDDYRWELKGEGFTDAEVEYALKNCKVNWNERAVYCAKGYGQGYEETIIHLTQVQGFTMEQAIYGVENMN